MINRLLWLHDHPNTGLFPSVSRVVHFCDLDVTGVTPPDHHTWETGLIQHVISSSAPWPEALAYIVKGFVTKLASAYKTTFEEYRARFGCKPEHITLFLDEGFKGGPSNVLVPGMLRGDEGCWGGSLRFGLAASDVPPTNHTMARWASKSPFPFMGYQSRLVEVRENCTHAAKHGGVAEPEQIKLMLWSYTGIDPWRGDV